MSADTRPADASRGPLSLLELAERAARRAGDFLAAHLGQAGRIDRKGAIDLVTDADRRAEALIIETIQAAAPEHAILTEEQGSLGPEHALVRWIVDPLDGTTNFAHAFAMFAVSVAAELRGEVVAGAVYVPVLGEMFLAERGAGAVLRRRRGPAAGSTSGPAAGGNAPGGDPETPADLPLRVSTVERLDEAFLATGFPYDIRDNPDNNLDHFAAFATRSLAIRRAGAAALDLAYMACGRFDGFWELRLKPWDWAAGALLIEEAGGRVTTIDGAPFHLQAPGICASNGRIHAQMLALLARGRSTAGA